MSELGVEDGCAAVPVFTLRAKNDCDLVERFKVFWVEVEVEKVVRRTRRGPDIGLKVLHEY